MEWCTLCGATHGSDLHCPEGLEPQQVERYTWRVNVDTSEGIIALGVLMAPCDRGWRARILTYPNVLWLVPRGNVSLKFSGSDAVGAERQAIDFIRLHCRAKHWIMRDEIAIVHAEPLRPTTSDAMLQPDGVPAPRRVRFLPVRYGIDAISEKGGTGDLSETGIFVITDRPASRGTWLNLALEVDGDPLALHGVVRWGRAGHHVGRAPGMGIQLKNPPSTYVDYIRRLE